jgi:2-polyprenyl-3-methyl-5-hydroxy-6-metoxy-1,4-benzoquinol methylase
MSRWWRREASAQVASDQAAAVAAQVAESLPLEFPDCIAREFPDVFDAAWTATTRVVELLDGASLTPLERRSPALEGYDWRGYLRYSVARVVRALDALSSLRAGARVLDVGAYFGNFSLAAAMRGFDVDALDGYRGYDDAFAPWLELMRLGGVRAIDFDRVGADLHGIADETYDAAMVMGVIEHVPHSPRALLTAIRRVLNPGGAIVLDTPNIAYAYNRERLARGESIMAPIASQFDCDPPFEGHHREYTIAEVEWMLRRVGFEAIAIDAFNYSLYGLGSIAGEDLRLYREMQEDPTRRELIVATARRPRA